MDGRNDQRARLPTTLPGPEGAHTMPGKRSRTAKDDTREPSKKLPAPVEEFVRLLEQIQPQNATGRLQMDMARDAALDIIKQLVRQVDKQRGRVDRGRRKRRAVHERFIGLLHDLTNGPLPLPRLPGRPEARHEDLVVTFRKLKTQDYPLFARTLHDAVGKGDSAAFQHLLVDEVFIKGSCILVEYLIRHAARLPSPEEEKDFLESLRHHIAGNVLQELSKHANYAVTLEVGQQLDALLVRTLSFLVDLLTASPPGRLVVPENGTPFDPETEEALNPKASGEGRVVRATLFPGYAVLEPARTVREKALVITQKTERGS